MKKLRKEKGFSEETRKKISEKLKGNKHFEGKKRTKEAIQKTVESHYKRVQCTDGNFIKEFNCVKEACFWWMNNGNSVKSWKSVAYNIKQSNTKNVFVKGLKWKYI